MSNIQPYYMHQSGSIPGIAGYFAGGQTVYVDMDEMVVVAQSPILQQPDNAQPLVEALTVQPQPTDSNQSSAKAKKGSK